MYHFELLTLSLSALMLGIFILSNVRHAKVLLGLIGLLDVVLVVQIAKQNFRWNFTLLYLAGLILTSLMLYIMIKPTHFTQIKIKTRFKVMNLILFATVAFLLYAFPVPSLTSPTGLYFVGDRKSTRLNSSHH